MFRAKEPWPKRVGVALLAPALTMALFFLLGYPPAKWLGAFRIAARAVEPGHQLALFERPYGVFSLGHGADILNAILLSMPVPLILAVAGILGRWSTKQPNDPDPMFLGLAAIPGLAIAVTPVLPVAPSQGWDLTATLLLPIAGLAGSPGFNDSKLSMR